MGAPPNQPPGNRPYRYDPMTGQMVQDPAPAQPQAAYQQPAVVQSPQPQAAAPFVVPQQAATPQVVPQQAAAPYAAPQQGFQPQAAAYAAPAKKDESMALVALLMAAGAWVMQFHILLSIPAIIVGFMARKKIKADPDRNRGDGLAKIGIIAGFVNVWRTVRIEQEPDEEDEDENPDNSKGRGGNR